MIFSHFFDKPKTVVKQQQSFAALLRPKNTPAPVQVVVEKSLASLLKSKPSPIAVETLPSVVVVSKDAKWEALHPRYPAGSPKAGKFMEKDSSDYAEAVDLHNKQVANAKAVAEKLALYLKTTPSKDASDTPHVLAGNIKGHLELADVGDENHQQRMAQHLTDAGLSPWDKRKFTLPLLNSEKEFIDKANAAALKSYNKKMAAKKSEDYKKLLAQAEAAKLTHGEHSKEYKVLTSKAQKAAAKAMEYGESPTEVAKAPAQVAQAVEVDKEPLKKALYAAAYQSSHNSHHGINDDEHYEAHDKALVAAQQGGLTPDEIHHVQSKADDEFHAKVAKGIKNLAEAKALHAEHAEKGKTAPKSSPEYAEFKKAQEAYGHHYKDGAVEHGLNANDKSEGVKQGYALWNAKKHGVNVEQVAPTAEAVKPVEAATPTPPPINPDILKAAHVADYKFHVDAYHHEVVANNGVTPKAVALNTAFTHALDAAIKAGATHLEMGHLFVASQKEAHRVEYKKLLNDYHNSAHLYGDGSGNAHDAWQKLSTFESKAIKVGIPTPELHKLYEESKATYEAKPKETVSTPSFEKPKESTVPSAASATLDTIKHKEDTITIHPHPTDKGFSAKVNGETVKDKAGNLEAFPNTYEAETTVKERLNALSFLKETTRQQAVQNTQAQDQAQAKGNDHYNDWSKVDSAHDKATAVGVSYNDRMKAHDEAYALGKAQYHAALAHNPNLATQTEGLQEAVAAHAAAHPASVKVVDPQDSPVAQAYTGEMAEQYGAYKHQANQYHRAVNSHGEHSITALNELEKLQKIAENAKKAGVSFFDLQSAKKNSAANMLEKHNAATVASAPAPAPAPAPAASAFAHLETPSQIKNALYQAAHNSQKLSGTAFAGAAAITAKEQLLALAKHAHSKGLDPAHIDAMLGLGQAHANSGEFKLPFKAKSKNKNLAQSMAAQPKNKPDEVHVPAPAPAPAPASAAPSASSTPVAAPTTTPAPAPAPLAPAGHSYNSHSAAYVPVATEDDPHGLKQLDSVGKIKNAIYAVQWELQHLNATDSAGTVEARNALALKMTAINKHANATTKMTPSLRNTIRHRAAKDHNINTFDIPTKGVAAKLKPLAQSIAAKPKAQQVAQEPKMSPESVVTAPVVTAPKTLQMPTSKEEAVDLNKTLAKNYYILRKLHNGDNNHPEVASAYKQWNDVKDHMKANLGYDSGYFSQTSSDYKNQVESEFSQVEAKKLQQVVSAKAGYQAVLDKYHTMALVHGAGHPDTVAAQAGLSAAKGSAANYVPVHELDALEVKAASNAKAALQSKKDAATKEIADAAYHYHYAVAEHGVDSSQAVNAYNTAKNIGEMHGQSGLIDSASVKEAFDSKKKNAVSDVDQVKAFQDFIGNPKKAAEDYDKHAGEYEYLKGDALQKFINDGSAKVQALSKIAHKAMKDYTDGDYSGMNKALAGEKEASSYDKERSEALVQGLETSLGKNVKLRRNMPQKWFWKSFGLPIDDNGAKDSVMQNYTEQQLNSVIGKIYHEPAFSSASFDGNNTTCLANTANQSGAVVLRIRANANAKGICVNTHSSCSSEREVLLQRGATYVIRKITKIANGNGMWKWDVEADLIGHMDAKALPKKGKKNV